MKTLIICCDGTWQNSDGGAFEVPTNITRLSRAIKSHTSNGSEQIVYYQSGVGTGFGIGTRFIGGAFGEGLSEHVREAYGFLADNFRSGDQVVLIGFSRGAYTARSVCGLIIHIGILTKRGMDHFYKIYRDYKECRLRDPVYVESIKVQDNGTWIHPNSNYVCAIGCFDTVGSLGIPTLGIFKWQGFNKRYGFYDTNLAQGNVGYAFHALALDENRGPFAPTLWQLPPIPDISVLGGRSPTVLRQCWFPGAHTNVGGGYDDQEIADVTMIWMIEMLSVVAGCVEFDDKYLSYILKNDDNHRARGWGQGTIYNSATGMFRLVGGHYRTPGAYTANDGGETCETVHASVRVRHDLLSTQKPSAWNCKPLKGWDHYRDESITDRVAYKWVKRDFKTGKIIKELKEEPLGAYEKRLAGKDVIVRYFDEQAWEEVNAMDVDKLAARAGEETPLNSPVTESPCARCGFGALGKYTPTNARPTVQNEQSAVNGINGVSKTKEVEQVSKGVDD